MKSVLPFAAAFLLNLAAAHALPNLLTNGDFASGVLTPWTATGTATISGGVCTLNNATLSQTVATVPGTRYYLVLDPSLGFGGGSNVSLTATPAAGGMPDGTKSVPPSTFQVHGVLIFTASTISTRIDILGTFASSGFNTPPTVDNIKLFALSKSRFAGKYAGTLTKVMSSTSLGLIQRAATRLIASIDNDGRIVIFDNTENIDAGQIFSDGTYDIVFNNYLPSTGSVSFVNGTISFRVNTDPFAGTDEGGNSIDAATSMAVVLTRTNQ